MSVLNRIAKRKAEGFTVVEVIVASVVMIILCVGLLSVSAYVIRVNRGEKLRMQALAVLQQECEYVRSLKFVPVGSSAELNAGTYNNIRTRTSPDGRVFNVSIEIVNLPAGTTNDACRFKEIRIAVVPQISETGWLSNLRTNLTVQRVRSN